MTKARKVIGLFTVLLASMLLVACGQKTTKDGVPSILQDKYSGYSNVDGYKSGVFSEGGSELVFDKEKHTIVNLSNNDGKNIYYYQVIPEDKLSSENKGILAKHKEELQGKDYFIIWIANDEKDIKKEAVDDGLILYGVVLSDGGKSIRIFEFEWQGGSSDLYYNFTGQATK
ncbi:TPA: hypothetical protein U1C34_001857 [Streptococcus suis]|nr:hypothetical protein [Streptococcus suis]HEM3623049.1 hypothetical protein [Streptococcus suis]